MKRLYVTFCAALASAVLGGISCATSDGSGPNGGDAAIEADATPLGFDAQQCALRCSADLHSVVDCHDDVVTTCADNQGCGASSTCVEACQAATDNHTSVGCDYFAVAPPVYNSSCLAAFVVNTWSSPIGVSVDLGGTALDATQFTYLPTGSGVQTGYALAPGGAIPPGQTGIVFLAQGTHMNGFPDCPVGTSFGAPIPTSGTGIMPAFHIKTTAPVVAYDIFPYGGGPTAVTGASLLLPTSSWGDNYIASTGSPDHTVGKPWISLVAAEDQTSVTILPTAAIIAQNGVAGTSSGVAQTYVLQRGQALRVLQNADLSGSIISSDKNVAFFGGNSAANVPGDFGTADGMYQQIAPVKALGSEYVAVRYRARVDGLDESVPWRVVGAVDGTTLSFDPPVPSAPTSIARGQVLEFLSPGPFVVTSQDGDHPFYFAAHMTGAEYLDALADDAGVVVQGGAVGDPETVNVVPTAQFMSQYVFFTDPTYPETNLVFVRKRDGAGAFRDVTLDCAGVLKGWLPVGGSAFQYTRVDLVRGAFEPQGACDNGRHATQSDGLFALTVWGWGTSAGHFALDAGLYITTAEAVSYAYPAGASVRPVNNVVIPIPK